VHLHLVGRRSRCPLVRPYFLPIHKSRPVNNLKAARSADNGVCDRSDRSRSCLPTGRREHRQHGIRIDIQTYFARQTIQMKKVHTRPQCIFNAVPSRVVCHQIPHRDFDVIGQEERWMFATQSRHRNLSNLSFVTRQFDAFINVANLLMATLWNIDYSIDAQIGFSIKAFVSPTVDHGGSTAGFE